ncbi:MAG: hypothetical protein QNJ62_08775, partial [Methyloceanibacter sp.]|nr:hypothetical protein [Methyloceanibacter sp.]
GATGFAVAASAAISLSVALKNYYAEYEIVEQCARQAQLTREDVETASTAIDVIEKYYFGRDQGLNKARLKREAVADKNDSFKILERSGESGFRPYCQMSLNELVRKAQEVGEPSGGN